METSERWPIDSTKKDTNCAGLTTSRAIELRIADRSKECNFFAEGRSRGGEHECTETPQDWKTKRSDCRHWPSTSSARADAEPALRPHRRHGGSHVCLPCRSRKHHRRRPRLHQSDGIDDYNNGRDGAGKHGCRQRLQVGRPPSWSWRSLRSSSILWGTVNVLQRKVAIPQPVILNFYSRLVVDQRERIFCASIRRSGLQSGPRVSSKNWCGRGHAAR